MWNEIKDFAAPELDVYARTSEVQLLRYYEPEPGIFIAESPKVIERALHAGYQPVSFLVEHKDLEREAGEILKKYPDVPYFMLGHSMGSFLLRQYLTMYAEGLAGVVIMGTGHQGMLTLCAGRMICRIIAAFKGWKYRSTFVDNLSFGGFNKKFEPGETSKEWITSDKKKRDEYVRDPLCSYTFTLGAYYQMFAGMKVLVRKGSMKRIPKTLPVLFTAGSDDPVGAFGKNVIRVYEKYKDAGIKDVSIHLYKGDRHEILNEVDRQNVYQDILAWIEEKNRR